VDAELPLTRSAVVVAAAIVAALPAGATVQSRGQQRCLDGLHGATVRMAAVVTKTGSRCVARGTKGRLAPGETAAQCLATGDGGRHDGLAHLVRAA